MTYIINRKKHKLSFFIILSASLTCIALSIWQINRYFQKKEYIEIIMASEKKAAMHSLPKVLTKDYDARKFDLSLKIISNMPFLRDNVYKGNVKGYTLYYPVIYNNVWYILKYGWSVKKKPDKILNPTEISGVVYCPKGKEFIIKQIPINKNFPKVIQRFDIDEMTKLLGIKVGPCILDVAGEKPYKNMISPARHIGYAIQWLLFSFLIIYIFLKSTNEDQNAKT